MQAIMLIAILFLWQSFLAPAVGATTLSEAIERLDAAAVRAALKAGADPNERDRLGRSAIDIVFNSIFSPKGRASAIQQVNVEEKAIEVLNVLLEGGTILKPMDADSHLGSSVLAGSYKLAKIFLERGANPNGMKDITGLIDAPIVVATKKGHPEIIKLLLEFGATPLNPSVTAQIRFIGAAEKGDLEGMKLELSKGATVDGKTPNGETGLVNAAKECRVEAVSFLLSNGATPNLPGKHVIMGGIAPLHAALVQNVRTFQSRGCDVIVRSLLAAGAYVSSTDDLTKMTPLHIAARSNNAVAVRMLLEAGANVMPKDADGKTPLDYAVSGEVIKLLKAHGAKE